MADCETYRAVLRSLRGADVPNTVEEQIDAALRDPDATPYVLKNLCRSAARKIVEAYPRNQVDWQPEVDEQKCMGCGKCVAFCQHGVYELINGTPMVTHAENCVLLCDHCVPVCPAGAILFPPHRTYLELLTALRGETGHG